MEASDEVLALDELLAPISEGEPAGPDLSNDDRYAEIERAFAPPASTGYGQKVEYGRVVELSRDFLRESSKDLRIAARLAAAWIHEEGLRGLAGGLELLDGLLQNFWDELHPDVPGRAAVLSWFGSDDISYMLYYVPLTEAGHTYFHYKEWAEQDAAEDGDKGDKGDKGGKTEPKGSADELSAANFGQSFDTTRRPWYESLCAAADRSEATLQRLDEFGKERFAEAGARPPYYRDLADALKWVAVAARDLLGRKPAPAPGEVPAPADGAGETSGSEAPSSPTATGEVRATAEPRDPAEAARAIASAARVLRRANPCDPAPYLVVRGFRWGEILGDGEHPDPRDLVPPTTDQRTRLKTLFLDEAWADLLDATEEIMATPAGRGWLDLQRYAVIAAERLGPEYDSVAGALRNALRGLLTDLPGLRDATLMDDSATASRDTIVWLESQGLTGTGTSEDAGDDASDDTDARRVVRQASFARAAKLARAGDAQGAIELLMERAEHEGSERARFITRAEAAGIMVDHDLRSLARPILDELHTLINEHKLEEWEPAEVVGKPLALLIRCLEPRDGALRQQLYGRLAKVDPLLAMRVSGGGVGQPGSAKPPAGQAPGEEQTPPQTEAAEAADG